MAAPSPSSGPPPTTTSAAANPPRSFNQPAAMSPSLPVTLRPQVYAAQPLLGKPLNPPQPPPPPQAVLFSANRGFQMRAAAASSRPHSAAPSRPHPDQAVTVANPACYIKNSSPTAVMTYATGQTRPHVFSTDPAVHAAVQAGMRPPQLNPSSQFASPRPVGAASSAACPPKSVPIVAHPKVSSIPTVSSTSEYNNSKDRDKSREDTVVTIHDRKVRLSDGGSGSLYALCRSWVRNGLPQEHQLNFGDGVKLLPRPLPASTIGSDTSKNSEDGNEADDPGKELAGYDKQLSTSDLLERLVKRSKRVRAQFRKERVRRIARYKQRLSLLLPPSNEMGRSDAAPRT